MVTKLDSADNKPTTTIQSRWPRSAAPARPSLPRIIDAAVTPTGPAPALRQQAQQQQCDALPVPVPLPSSLPAGLPPICPRVPSSPSAAPGSRSQSLDRPPLTPVQPTAWSLPSLLAGITASSDLRDRPASSPSPKPTPPLSSIDPALTSEPAPALAPPPPVKPAPPQKSSPKPDLIDVALLSLSQPANPPSVLPPTTPPNGDQQAPTLLTSEMVEHSLTPIRIGKNWACRICHRQFTRRFNCTTHERTHLNLNERAQFQCGLCTRAFTRRHDLERHVHSVHPGHMLEKEPPGSGSSRLPITILPSSFRASSPPKRKVATGAGPAVKIRRLQDGEIVRKKEVVNPPEQDISRIVVIDQATQDPFLVDPCLSWPSTNPSALLLSSTPNGPPPTAILTTGSIRDVSQAVERVALEALPALNPLGDPIFKVDKKWACGICGRLFVRRNNCKAHEATHRDVREHACPRCRRSFSRRHDLERHITAVHPSGTFSADPCNRSLSPPASQRASCLVPVRAKTVTPIDSAIRPKPIDEKSFNIFETFPVPEAEEEQPKQPMEIDPSLESTLMDVRTLAWGEGT